MRRRNSETRSGAGLLGCFLWILVLLAGGYVAVKLGAPYVDYWRFRDAMQTQAELAAVVTDEGIRRSLAETAEQLDIPLEPREIHIRRERRTITIRAKWTREVVLPRYRRTLHFQPAISATLTSQSK
jgi:hypothetical protein